MAFGATPTNRGTAGATANTATTASFTPAAGELLIANGLIRGTGTVPVITDSLGGTWTLLAGSDVTQGNVRTALYTQKIGNAPVAMTVTATTTGATQCAVAVVGVSDAQVRAGTLVSDVDAAGDPSLTMAAFQSGAMCIAFQIQNAGSAPTVIPTGYSPLVNSALATNLRSHISYDVSSPGTALAWTSTGTDAIGIGIELEQSAGIAAPVSIFGAGSNGATQATSSFTPAANTRLLVFGTGFRNSATATKPAITDSVGLTWTELGQIHHANTTTADIWIVAWISNSVGASPASMTVTVTSTSGSQTAASVMSLLASEISGAATQVATTQADSGDPSLTFGSALANDAISIIAEAHIGGQNSGPPSAFTELQDFLVPSGGSRTASASYDVRSPTAGPHAWSNIAAKHAAIGLELAAYSAAAPSTYPVHLLAA